MPALDHRELALKLAVENYAVDAPEDDDRPYSLLDDNGEIDESLLAGVLTLAERFNTWLGADAPAAAQPAAAPATTRRPSEKQRVLDLIRSKSGGYGVSTVRTMLDTAQGLRDGAGAIEVAIGYTREGSLTSLLGSRNAEDFLSSLQRLPAA